MKIGSHKIGRGIFLLKNVPGGSVITGLHQYGGFTARPAGTQDILGAVAHHDGPGEIDAVTALGGPDQPGFGFAARAILIGPVGAVKDVRNFPAAGDHGPAHAVVHLFQCFSGNHAAVDSRLVGDDDDGDIIFNEAGDGLPAAGNETELRPAFDIVGGVDVDNAVAVEENGGDCIHAGVLSLISGDEQKRLEARIKGFKGSRIQGVKG